MRIADAKSLLTQIFLHNLEQFEKGRSHNQYVCPFFIGDPGVGKTAIPRQVAAELSEQLADEMGEIPYFQTIVAQYDAGEMAGLPFKASVATGQNDKGPIYEDRMIRLRPSYLPEANYGIYNLDELPQAFLANQNICSQMVNEWRVGEHEIPKGITICATGNKPENKAGTTTMPTHLRDRLMFIPIEVSHDDWLHYAASHGVDPRIRSFIRQNPALLHKFEVTANASPTPRSWEKSSAILSMDLAKHVRKQALDGTIGDGAATTFETWLRVEDKMPKLEDVINRPKEAPVFTNKEADVLYLLLANLADVAEDKNIENILEYIKRLPNQEFAAYWASDTFTRNRKLLENKHVTKWKMTHGAKLLY